MAELLEGLLSVPEAAIALFGTRTKKRLPKPDQLPELTSQIETIRIGERHYIQHREVERLARSQNEENHPTAPPPCQGEAAGQASSALAQPAETSAQTEGSRPLTEE